MKRIFQKLNLLLDQKQKRTMMGLMVLMIIGAFLQMASVGVLVETVNVVIDPEAVAKSKIAGKVYEMMGNPDFNMFSIAVMSTLIVSFFIKNGFLYFQHKATLAFVYTNQFRTSERLMRNYLRRPYEFYLNADTAVIQRSITSDVRLDSGAFAADVRRCHVFVRGVLLFPEKWRHDGGDGKRHDHSHGDRKKGIEADSAQGGRRQSKILQRLV